MALLRYPRDCARRLHRGRSECPFCARASSARKSRVHDAMFPIGSPALLKIDPPQGSNAERFKLIQERVATGIDPLYFGELVREAIENDWPYIFTDTEFEPFVDGRFAAIKQGFERIRGRQPRR